MLELNIETTFYCIDENKKKMLNAKDEEQIEKSRRIIERCNEFLDRIMIGGYKYV